MEAVGRSDSVPVAGLDRIGRDRLPIDRKAILSRFRGSETDGEFFLGLDFIQVAGQTEDIVTALSNRRSSVCELSTSNFNFRRPPNLIC